MASGARPANVKTGEVRADAPFGTHLASALSDLLAERATGVLELEAAMLRASFYLSDGIVVFAGPGTLGESIAQQLIREGKLDEDECALIVERMTESVVDDEVMRFGEIALELGMLSSDDVSSALGQQVRDKLVRALAVHSLRWSFRVDPKAVSRVAHYPCPLPAAVLASTLAAGEPERWASLLERLSDAFVGLRPGADLTGLPPDALRMCRLLDGKRTIGEALAASRGPADRNVGVLATLFLLGLFEQRDAPEPAPATSPKKSLRPKRGDESRRPPPGSLAPRAGRTASLRPSPAAESVPAPARARASLAPMAITRAARAATESSRGRPAKHGPVAAPATPRAATALQAALRTAGASRAARAAPADATPEQLYERGRRALCEGQLAGARRLLEEAAAAAPNASEVQLAAAFARWLTTRSPAEQATEVVIVRAQLKVVMAANRRSAFAYYVHGRLLLAEGDEPAGAQALRNAARLDPDDLEMARWARHVGPPTKPKKA